MWYLRDAHLKLTCASQTWSQSPLDAILSWVIWFLPFWWSPWVTPNRRHIKHIARGLVTEHNWQYLTILRVHFTTCGTLLHLSVDLQESNSLSHLHDQPLPLLHSSCSIQLHILAHVLFISSTQLYRRRYSMYIIIYMAYNLESNTLYMPILNVYPYLHGIQPWIQHMVFMRHP
jgi:hypothetical protein